MSVFRFPSKDKGVLILPVELIDDNGAKLKSIVLRYAKEWELGDEFISWLRKAVILPTHWLTG